MVDKRMARTAAVVSSLAATLSLSAVASPPASADFPDPPGGLTYHWSPVKSWTPDGTQAKCKYRNGWALLESGKIRFRYEINCDTRAVSLGNEAYIQRNDKSIVDDDNTKTCYDTHFCAQTFNIANPGGAQDWYSTSRWAWTRWTNNSPWLRQTFSK